MAFSLGILTQLCILKKVLKSSRLSKYKSSKAIKLSRTKSRFNKTKIFKLKGGGRGRVQQLANQYEEARYQNTSGNFYNSNHPTPYDPYNPYNHTSNNVGKSGHYPNPYLHNRTSYANPYPYPNTPNINPKATRTVKLTPKFITDLYELYKNDEGLANKMVKILTAWESRYPASMSIK